MKNIPLNLKSSGYAHIFRTFLAFPSITQTKCPGYTLFSESTGTLLNISELCY